jgi:N-acetylmuramoyl-L-alanine amidase
VAQGKQLARAQFDTAERMRQELSNRPVASRTAQDYKRVIEAYRRVYYLAPGSSKADVSAFSVAELLAESGRRFKDPQTLHSAIGQYQFLRHEYPGSKYRVRALFAIGLIYKEELNDRQQAKASFEEFLKHYPGSELVGDAQAALKDLQQPPGKQEKNRGVKEVASRQPVSRELDKPVQNLERVSGKEADRGPQEGTPKSGGLPLVVGIRHWSTPDYTRVAIDLESQVEYQAGRVPNPDRIFFDLHSTKLASSLVGRSIEVEDGLLRKIRIAQYQKDMTRVVLEVDNVSDYSAFLLPNPYRLIIDVHGRQMAHKVPPLPRSVPPQTATSSLAPARAATPQPAREAAAKAGTSTPLPPTKRPNEESATSLQAVPKPVETTAAVVPKSEKPAPPEAISHLPEGTAPPAADSRLQKPLESAKPSGDAKPSEAKTRLGDRTTGEPDATTNLPQQTKTGPPSHDAQDRRVPETAPGGDPVIARLDSPELKSSKPTTAPTYESVAPRTPAAPGKRHVVPVETTGHEARPAANGQRTLIRALGLKVGRIVVDAGHGGHDTGTVGPGGLQEKDLTLDVALRLGKLLETKLGADVIYTRDDDTFVPLETRTAIANQNQADLFISIHANSSKEASARGVETYYLNFTSSAEALEVAARENAVSEKSVHELQDLVKKIALKEKVGESHEFAGEVQKSLWGGLAAKSPGLRNRGVKKAPFIVLIGANMPSVLAEISFLSNPADERRLKTPEYRQRIAEYLYRGITHYASGLSGVKVAQTR